LGLVRLLNDIKKDVQLKPIRYKERSERVKTMQRRLGAIGVDAGIADGIFGRGTLKAIRKFQKYVRLRPDGIVGSKTWDELWK
jgi:peptidoglycan hydrolase-like protein with peptidoglycan-binding domain